MEKLYSFPDDVRCAYEAMPMAVVYDQFIGGKVVPLLVSDGFCKLIGMDRAHALMWFRDNQFERVHPDDIDRVKYVSREFANHRDDYDLVLRTLHEDGYHLLHVTGKWQTMEDGTELAVLNYSDLPIQYDDMSENANHEYWKQRYIAEKQRKEERSEALRTSVVEALTRVYDSVWLITDLENQEFELLRIDEETAHMMPAHEAIKRIRFSDALQFYSRLVLEEDREQFLEATLPENIKKNTEEKPIYSVAFRRVFEHGTRYYRLEFAGLKPDSGESYIVAGFKDVDEEVRKNQKMNQALREAIDLAETDRMTGLFNRVTGEIRVSERLDMGENGMFVLFDVDHFKLFNDRLGHNVGDQVLIAVASCLKNTFRGEDIVMRLGGDEFAAFASGVTTQEVGEKILQRFYDSLNNTVIREGMEKIGVSAGAVFRSQQEDISFRELYETADQAMYESKRFYDGRVTFR